ncbi:glycosyltransferase family 4 protein [Bizionia saleffrena]|uniref:Glycosyltransferase family 4 protein n=1 Tax=Bizionia saleffrena TaxID=291189 RepID=A0A8H2QMX3_9FLAO|nr:glycosyltransferase [Bizionia saleffrena]TYB80164.1 glycosyltransferase family 4 protein [Bizionia saleffrena]
MRILMVSMNSIHFQRWTNQLKDSGHDVFWFDIADGAKVPSLSWVKTYRGWKHKLPNIKGRYFIKNKLPKLYRTLENDTAKAFERVLLEVKPDVVHSFVLYISCTPILRVMQKHKNLKWIYSSWGSDLYHFKNSPKYKKDILRILPRLNYLFTDCQRDVKLAKELGFKGKVLGTFPGGGGYDFSLSDKFIKTPVLERTVILIKGYQGRSGRAIEVLKALELLVAELYKYKIVVFGADTEVVTYLATNIHLQKLDITVLAKTQFLPHEVVLELMGKARIYIGNSDSDGMPNTLLEAVIQGAFPIQSNPGGATEDVITQNKNGLRIQDCRDIEDIKQQIKTALENVKLIENAFNYNQKVIKPKLEIDIIRTLVLKAYQSIDNRY